MTRRDNIIYYTITAVVFVGIVVCSVWSQPNTTNTEMNEEKQGLVEVIAPYAPIIEDTDPQDESDWPQQFEWFTTKLERFNQVFRERIRELDATDWENDALEK